MYEGEDDQTVEMSDEGAAIFDRLHLSESNG